MEHALLLQRSSSAALSKGKGAFWRCSSLFILSFLIPALLLGLVYVYMGMYPFGEKSLLIWDGSQQYIDFFAAYRDALTGDGSLLFSWSKALGGDMLSLASYYLLSPFNFIILLFPKALLTEAVFAVTLVKVGAAGVTFALFLRKHISSLTLQNSCKIIAFSVCYALCGYCLSYSMSLFWLDGIIFLPLIIWRLELLIEKGNWVLYTVFLAIMMISNYYIAFMICIFLVCYFFYYHFSHFSFRAGKVFAKKLLLFGGASLLAGGIAAAVLIPNFFSLQAGKLVGSTIDWGDVLFKLHFSIPEIASKLLPGSFDTIGYKGLPNIFCGLLAVVLIPLFYTNKEISLKQKLLSLFIFAVFLVSFSFTGIDYIWHGFQQPVCFPFRYSFLFSFFLLYLAFQTLQKIKSVPWLSFVVSIFFTVGIIMCGKAMQERFAIKEEIVLAGLLFCCAYLAILILIKKNTSISSSVYPHKKIWGNIFAVILVALCIGENLYNSGWYIQGLDNGFRYDSRESYTKTVEKNQPVIDKIQQDDNGFYRIEKNYQRSFNDAMSLNYKALTHYSSSYNASLLNFTDKMGILQLHFWSSARGATLASASLLNIKYLCSKQVLPQEYEFLWQQEDIKVYKNPYALSVGFTANSGVKSLQLAKDMPNSFAGQNQLLSAIAGTNTAYFTPLKLQKNTQQDSKNTTAVEYRMQVQKGQVLYLSMKGKDLRPFEIILNGSKIPNTYLQRGDNAPLCLGTVHATGDAVLKIRPTKSGYTANNISVYALDIKKFEDFINHREQLDVTEYGNSYIQGNINIKDKQENILFTSIPYDKGWKVTVDGKKTETLKLADSLLAVEVPEGEHTIFFRYIPKGLPIGLTISCSCIAILALLLFIKKKKSGTYIKEKI